LHCGIVSLKQVFLHISIDFFQRILINVKLTSWKALSLLRSPVAPQAQSIFVGFGSHLALRSP